MPVSRNAHHAQIAATPFSRTRFVTRFGVSVLNVVATIETPTSHHGAARPEVKNSAVLLPARRARRTAGMKEMTIDATTIAQSRVVRDMWGEYIGRSGAWVIESLRRRVPAFRRQRRRSLGDVNSAARDR